MKFTYAPEGREPQDFEFLADQLTREEAELAEDAGEHKWQTFGEWIDLLDRASIRAWNVALWIMLRRSEPELGLNKVNPKVGELQIDTSEPEGKGESGEETTEAEDSPINTDSPAPVSEP